MADAAVAHPELFDVRVAGGVLRVGRWRATDPRAAMVLASHDLTANLHWWGPLAAALAGSVDLVAPDARGRAGSMALPGPWGLDRHADDLAAVADNLGVGRVVLLGHGYGAWVATAAAARLAGRAAAVVRLRAVPRPAASNDDGEDRTAPLRAALDNTATRLDSVYPDRNAYLAAWRTLAPIPGGLDRAARDALLADLRGSGFTWRPAVDLAAVDHDAAEVTALADQRPSGLPDADAVVRSYDGGRHRLWSSPTAPGDDLAHVSLLLERSSVQALATYLTAVIEPLDETAPPDADGHLHRDRA